MVSKPRREDFDSYEDYEDALDRYDDYLIERAEERELERRIKEEDR